MMTSHEPTSTRLINIPVILDGKSYKLVIYTNDLKVPEDTNALMIVPFPNPKNTDNFGLVNVSTDRMKKFRKNLYENCERLKPVEYEEILLLSAGPTMKKIHNIGNYDISVANNLEELKKNIDWTKFRKPNNFEARLSTFTNKDLYPEDNYFYVVASAKIRVKNDGFGVVFPDPGYDYFPTAHEIKNDQKNDVKYNVKLYNFSKKKISLALFGNYFLRAYNFLNDDPEHNEIIRLLDNKMMMSKDGSERLFEAYLLDHNVNFFEIIESLPNRNMRFGFNDSEFKMQPIIKRKWNYEFNSDYESN